MGRACTEALAAPAARDQAIERAVSRLTVDPSMVEDVRSRLRAHSPEELAEHLIEYWHPPRGKGRGGGHCMTCPLLRHPL